MGAKFRSLFNYSANEIRCPKCGQRGKIVWEGQQFIEIRGGFYERIERKEPYAIELVCKGCGNAQREDDVAPPRSPDQPGPHDQA